MIRFDETDAAAIRQALLAAGHPTSPEEVARRARAAGKDPLEQGQRWDEAVEHAATKVRQARRGGPKRVPKLPTELVGATVRRAKAEALVDVNRAIDEVVTSRAGYAVLRRTYGILSDPDREFLVARLSGGARQHDPGIDQGDSLRAAEYVALRTQRLIRLMSSSGGSTRRAMLRALEHIEPAADPPAPVRIDATPHPMRWIDARRGIAKARIRYVDVNPDSKKGVVLLCHGHGSLLEEYGDLAPLLAERFRVLVPDLPVCGYSEKPARKAYTVGWFADSLVGFLDALGIEKAYAAGGSLGGNLTLRLALEHPDRFPRFTAWAPAGWIGTDPLLETGARIARNLGPWAFWLVYHQQKQTWYSDGWPGKVGALQQADLFRDEAYCRAYHDAYFDIAAEQVGTSWLEKAKGIGQPGLLLCGKNDHALDMYSTVKNQLVPSMHEAKFEDRFHFGRHSIASEDTEQLSKYLLDFLPDLT